MEDVKLLKAIPLFKGFSTTELLSINMVAKSKVYESGDTIVKEKAKGDGLYIIKRGRVRVVKTDSFGDEHVLAYLGSGEYFGEISLVDRAPRSASVIAEEESECVIIKHTDFQNLIAGNKEIERKFYKSFSLVLCERLRVADENLTFSQEITKLIQQLDKGK
jgi:CRP/FNR family cyclic AMP-dependent transcriptional regulator